MRFEILQISNWSRAELGIAYPCTVMGKVATRTENGPIWICFQTIESTRPPFQAWSR